MNIDNPELLPILLGNNAEKKALIASNCWNINELEFIWSNIIHEPNHSDSSLINSIDLHNTLLNQPLLPQNIITELFDIYTKYQNIGVLPEIYKHKNFPNDLYKNILNESLVSKNYQTIFELSNNKHMDKISIFKQFMTKTFVTELIKKSNIKNMSQDGILFRQIISHIISITEDSHLIASTFNWLKKENMMSLLWCHYFLINSNTTDEQLYFILSNFSREISDRQLIIILNHPNLKEKSLLKILEIIKKQPKTINSFNEIIKLVNNNKNLSTQILNSIIKIYPNHSEIYMPIINHPNFHKSVIWDSLSNSMFFNNLPTDVQDIILKKIKNG